jgi:hypothetical protein
MYHLKTLAKSSVVVNKELSALAKILPGAIQQQHRNFTEHKIPERCEFFST